MPSRSVGLARYFWGLGVSLVTLLVGAWLILAPFALGYQPYGADWASQTTNSFWVGIAVVVLSLLSLGLFVSSLMGSLRASGVIQARPQPESVTTGYPTAPAAAPSDTWERTMATLATALAEDLAERRRDSNGSNSHSSDQVGQSDRRDAA
jgi:hypothetical protein